MARIHALQSLSYSLFILPPLLLTVYLLSTFPNPRQTVFIHPSLATLPKAWNIYPEDYYSGGNYVSFPNGKVRYWIMGPEKGQKIVLIHGLSMPSLIWKNIAPELVARGYRVMLYDLYGRGYSDAPQTTYDASLYTTQLALLMQHVKWDKAIIMGVSMGAAIAASFTANFPSLVEDRVVLISSAGLMESNDISRTAKFMSNPVVQTVTSNWIIRMYLQRMADDKHPTPESDLRDLQEIVRLQSAYLPGYNAAISSSLREGPVRGQASSFASDAFAGRKVLIFHGTDDPTVPYRCAGEIKGMLPNTTNAELATVEGGGHDLTVTDAKELLEKFDEWMKL